MATDKPERVRREAEQQRRWEAMVAIYPTLLRDGTHHNPQLAAKLTREAADALLAEFSRRVR